MDKNTFELIKSKYGLRAIVVGAVILYHAQITILGHQPFKCEFIVTEIF